jgi:hypothetical protein
VTEVESSVVAAWRTAAEDLGIHFTSPFHVEWEGQQIEALGLVHAFGRRIGTIISVLHQPSSRVRHRAADDYYHSQLSDSYAQYRRQFFIDTLDDWKFFGPEAERPSWYGGKNWS